MGWVGVGGHHMPVGACVVGGYCQSVQHVLVDSRANCHIFVCLVVWVSGWVCTHVCVSLQHPGVCNKVIPAKDGDVTDRMWKVQNCIILVAFN